MPLTARMMAASCALSGLFLSRIQTYTMTRTGHRYCSTVAVPALERCTAPKKATWNVIVPHIPAIIVCRRSRRFLHNFSISSRFVQNKTAAIRIPEVIRRTGISQETLIFLVSNKNWPNTPETPHNTPADRPRNAPDSDFLPLILFKHRLLINRCL